MVTALDRLAKQQAAEEAALAARRQAAIPEYQSLLLRMAGDAEKPGDDDLLVACMTLLGLSGDDVRDHVQTVQKARELQRTIKDAERLIEPVKGAAAKLLRVRQAAREMVERAEKTAGIEDQQGLRKSMAERELMRLGMSLPGPLDGWQIPDVDTTVAASDPAQPLPRKRTK